MRRKSVRFHMNMDNAEIESNGNREGNAKNIDLVETFVRLQRYIFR